MTTEAMPAQCPVDVNVSPLPCPFCGDTDVSIVEGSTFRWRQVECNTCGARCGETRVRTIPHIDVKENERFAIEEWNRRSNAGCETAHPAVAGQVEPTVRPCAWLREQRSGYEWPATLAPLMFLGDVGVRPHSALHGATYEPLYSAAELAKFVQSEIDSAVLVITPDCKKCANRGQIDGLSQETHCEHCKHQESWREDHYAPNARSEAQP